MLIIAFFTMSAAEPWIVVFTACLSACVCACVFSGLCENAVCCVYFITRIPKLNINEALSSKQTPKHARELWRGGLSAGCS